MKIKANASKRKAMSSERMKKREAELQAEVDRWLAAAAAADAEEDKLHGARRGDELPKWVADKEERLAKIRAAKADPIDHGHRAVPGRGSDRAYLLPLVARHRQAGALRGS